MGPSPMDHFRQAGHRDRASDPSTPSSLITDPTWTPIIRTSGRIPRLQTSTPTATGLRRRIIDSSRRSSPTLIRIGLALRTRAISRCLAARSILRSNPRGHTFRSKTPTAPPLPTSFRYSTSRSESPSPVPTLKMRMATHRASLGIRLRSQTRNIVGEAAAFHLNSIQRSVTRLSRKYHPRPPCTTQARR